MLLHPDTGDVLLIDPGDPAHLARAREVIHGLAAPWHSDKTVARPGPECRTCPVLPAVPAAVPLAGGAQHRTEMRRSANDQAENRHGRP